MIIISIGLPAALLQYIIVRAYALLQNIALQWERLRSCDDELILLTRQSSLFSENGALCVGTAAVVAGSESPLSCWGLAGAGVEYLKSCRGEGGNVCLTNDVLSDAI